MHKRQSGFTLVEMAVVLVIIGLLIGGLFVPLSVQQDIKNIDGTRDSLHEIKEALMGFAALNGRLPCPSTETDPANAGYGVEDTSCAVSYTAEGYLPWKTLGVAETDEWGTKRTAKSDPWNGYWRYRVDRNFTTAINFSNNMLASSPLYGDTLSIVDASNNALTTTAERPIMIVFSTGKDLKPNGQNASYEATTGIYQSNEPSTTFDDMLVWIARPVLFSKMVSAGKLP